MRIGHVAIWTNNLEELKTFYTTYFNGVSNSKYVNLTKGFESYFIKFEGDTSLELMSRKDINTRPNTECLGICHLAFTVKSEDEVLQFTERLRAKGFHIAAEPRKTGDGYFESIILDPDGNRIEIVAE